MKPCIAIPKKYFVLEEENNCEEGINLTPQGRIGNINWCKCGCECKPMAMFAESFCLLLRLKYQSVGEHFSIQLLWPTAQLLVTRVSLIYLVDEFFVPGVAEQNENAA